MEAEFHPITYPKEVKISDIFKYDGTSDSRDHIIAYTTRIKGNNRTKEEIKSVFAKKFIKILTKGALTWYFHSPENFISSFAELADTFIKAYCETQKVERQMKDIFKIRQGDI